MTKTMLRGRTDAGLIERPVGIYEGTQEVLACPNYYCHAVVGYSSGICTRVCCCTVYLYAVLALFLTDDYNQTSEKFLSQSVVDGMRNNRSFDAGRRSCLFSL